MHGNILWGIDTEPDLVALDLEDGDGDFVADVEGFADTAGEDERNGLRSL